jgi:hypothetical protein
MSTYKITKVSEQPPRTWEKPKGGTIYYIKCAVEGWEKPIEVGKRSPDALHVGDELHGTITATEYPNDKFKADPPAFGGGGGGKTMPRGTTPEDKESIARAVALKASVDLHAANPLEAKFTTADLLRTADEFLAWLKNEAPQSDEPQYVEEGF